MQNDSKNNLPGVCLLQTVSNLLISSGSRFPRSAQPAVTVPQAHASTFTGLPQNHHIWGIISLASWSPEVFQRFLWTPVIGGLSQERESTGLRAPARTAWDLKVSSHLLTSCLWNVLQGCVALNPAQAKPCWPPNAPLLLYLVLLESEKNPNQLCSCSS